jgi:2-polyprenyl-6-methoxyphenol hydroxylase-like FAD-dependent oxidoreductase
MTTTDTARPGRSPLGGHAIVIGGSMAGLLAARVLGRHFERVTLIERDRSRPGPAFRKGVPSHGTCVLLGKGRAR